MPIYEYEPSDRDCLLCEGRVEVLQPIGEEALQFCPYCGLAVRRVVSRASFKLPKDVDPDKAARKGFSTFRRAGKGTWEKVAGPSGGEVREADSGGVLDASKIDEETA